MVVKIYVSGISGNKEVKKKQQRVQMILDSKSIVYEAIDITEPGREKDKETMQTKSKVREVLGKHPLPPQLFNDEEYCGDYEDFDLANEVDELEAFLHLPIPSKLISCDNDTLTAKVNGSREGVNDVTNGEPTEKVNGDVELTSINCDGDVSGPTTDVVSPAAEDEETADNDATPEENIVNSTPDEAQENPQTSYNEIEEEDNKENEIESEVAGEKTEDDRLDEDEKVEDEQNNDELITQESDVPNAANKTEEIISEQITQENDVPNAETKTEEIISEQITQQENDVPNAEIKIEEIISENKKVDEAEEIEFDSKGLMPASENLISKNENNDFLTASIDNMLNNKEETEINKTVTDSVIPENEKELNNDKMSTVEENMYEASASNDQTESCSKKMSKSSVERVASDSVIPSERQISELEKTEPVEWFDNITLHDLKYSEKTASPITQKPENQQKEEHVGDLRIIKQMDDPVQDLKSLAIQEEGLRKHVASSNEEKGEKSTQSTTSLVLKTEENKILTKETDLTSIEKENCSREISKKLETKKVSDSTDSFKTQIIENREKTEEKLLAVELAEEAKTESRNVSDVTSSSLKMLKELNVDSPNITNDNPKAVIVPFELSDDNLLIKPSPNVSKINLPDNIEDQKSGTAQQKDDTEDDFKWEGKPLCRRDTLKRIKRPSLPLIRPSSIKEESAKESEIQKPASPIDSSKSDAMLKQTINAPVIEKHLDGQNILIDINSNECTVELNPAGKHIMQSLMSPNTDSEKRISTSGANNPLNSSSVNMNSSNLRENVTQDECPGSSTSSSSQNPTNDSQNNNQSNSSAGSSNVNSTNLRGNNQNTLQSASGGTGRTDTSTPSSSQNQTSDNNQSNSSSGDSNVNLPNSQNNLQSASAGTRNATQEQAPGRADSSSSSQSPPGHSQNNNQKSINANYASGGNNLEKGTALSGSLNIQLEDASGHITSLDQIQLPDNTNTNSTDGGPEHHSGLPMKELLKENYVSPFSVDKIKFSPQLVSKIKSDSLRRDEKGVVLPNWDHRPSEVDLVRQVRYLLDERDTEIAISRARMRAGRSPLRDPHQHFVVEMKKMINKYKDEEEEVDWPVVPPPREPTPPPPEPPVNEFLEEVLRALNAPYIPKSKPPPEEPKENVFLNQVKVLLDSEQMTGDSQATFFQKERGPIEEPEFLHKVRVILNERESTLGLKPIEHPEQRDHTEFLSEVLVLLEEDPLEIPKPQSNEPLVVNVEPEAVKEEIITVEKTVTPSPVVKETSKAPVKEVKEKPVTKSTDDVPKKKEIEIAQIFIRDNIFPVTAQVSSDNFQIFVSALGSQKIELKKEDLDALTITVIEDNGYKSDVAKIVVSPNL